MPGHFFFPGFFNSFQLWSVLYTEVEGGWVYPNHKHPLFEILYVESGLMSEWVNGVEYRLGPGDLILINSGDLHYPESHERSQYFNFHFDVEPREVHAILHSLRKPLFSADLDMETHTEIRSWMEKLIQIFKSEKELKYTHKLQIHSCLLQFLSFLLEHVISTHSHEDAESSSSPRQIASEVAYLLETCGGSESVKVTELASRLNIHRNYVTKCFKRYYGMTPKHYLNKVRIEKAKRLLQESMYSVEEIADLLTFSSAAYFCKFFRSHVGITPMQYRFGYKRKAYKTGHTNR